MQGDGLHWLSCCGDGRGRRDEEEEEEEEGGNLFSLALMAGETKPSAGEHKQEVSSVAD